MRMSSRAWLPAHSAVLPFAAVHDPSMDLPLPFHLSDTSESVPLWASQALPVPFSPPQGDRSRCHQWKDQSSGRGPMTCVTWPDLFATSIALSSKPHVASLSTSGQRRRQAPGFSEQQPIEEGLNRIAIIQIQRDLCIRPLQIGTCFVLTIA